MFEIVVYKAELKQVWDNFIDTAKNGTFLFKRDYMDYHSDRFKDYSLLIYRKGKLLCLLPANKDDSILYSHQGLTYGGLIMSVKITVEDTLAVFDFMNNFLRSEKFKKVVYKPIPLIYHLNPAQEDLYAMFRMCNASIIGRNISSTIYQSSKIKFIESRKSGIRKAVNNNVIIKLSNDFESFWCILSDNLKAQYGVKPVHSLSEILFLQSNFPQNIKLYMAYKDEKPIGGTLLYITKTVVHTQYISANPQGKELGALDLLFDFLINKEFTNFPIFDFGQSTEQMGEVLNSPLIFQKEGFGGRGIIYDIYEYNL